MDSIHSETTSPLNQISDTVNNNPEFYQNVNRFRSGSSNVVVGVGGRRLLSSCISDHAANPQQQPQSPAATSSSGCNYQPSRKREEACVLMNLKRRLEVVKANQQHEPIPIESLTAASMLSGVDGQELDNRPHLFQKIISNRPVSMVLDSSDLRTAWQESDFITDCLCWHNVYRQRHSAPPFTMSTQLCYYAQTWANHLAHTNTFYYRNDKDIGQNLFCRPSNDLQTDVTGQEVASYWYMAVKQYDYTKEPDVLHVNVNAGHFTQMVWLKSRHFGVGKARSRSGKVIVVANYSPAGNVSGAFQTNVLPPMQVDYPPAAIPMLRMRMRLRTYSTGTSDSESSTSNTASTP